MASFRCIYCWPWPQSAYQYSASSFNFKEAFVSSVRKTSHNVLKKQKARYLYRNRSCKAYFIQRFIITPSHTSLNRLEDTASDRHLFFSPQIKKAACLTRKQRKILWIPRNRVLNWTFLSILSQRNIFTL